MFVVGIYVRWHIRHGMNILENQEKMLGQKEEDL
jgi:hypothetical protein